MTRRATIRTAHVDPEVVAAAIAPDNTDEMETFVADDDSPDAADDRTDVDAPERRVVTTIERDSTSGLQSTVDDTLVNLAVAERVAALTRDDDTTAAESTDDRQQTDTNDTP